MSKLLWVSSWDRRCGIADYSKALFEAVKSACAQSGNQIEVASLDEYRNSFELLSHIRSTAPSLVHFQHEYGLFGGKNPPGYWFPEIVDSLKRDFRSVRLTATAHTVLEPNYSFPTVQTGIQAPIRGLANFFLLPQLREFWGRRTWGLLDGIVCHSKYQIESLLASGARRVDVIPHFVYENTQSSGSLEPWEAGNKFLSDTRSKIIVFGFLSQDKGQDLVLEAFHRLKNTAHRPISLVFAGGVRRREDEKFESYLKLRMKELGLENDVLITGFVPQSWMNSLYEKSLFAIAPFRSTSGSGSLAQALARGAPVLASDLELNCEINERRPGTLSLFKTGDVESLSAAMSSLLTSEKSLSDLSKNSRDYARTYSATQIGFEYARWLSTFLKAEYN